MARDRRFEAAIIADPDQLENYAVYADWLQGQGDPRGELIALELRAHHSGHDAKLDALIMAVRARVMPHIAADLPTRGLSWRYGFIDGVTLDRSYARRPLVDLLDEVLSHPSAFAVRQLRLCDPYAEDNARDVIASLARIAPPALRGLTLQFDRDVGDLEPLYAFVLEDLAVGHVLAGRGDFIARRSAVSSACVRSIVNAPWRLHDLALDFEGGAGTVDDLVPLCERDLPLVTLALRHIRSATALCRALVDSPFAGRLERLELGGELQRADYVLLVEHRDRFRALREVQLPSRTYTKKLLGH